MSMNPADTADLTKLAMEEFGKLTESEKRLFEYVAKGEIADYSAASEEDNDPARAGEWGEDRVLKADRIAWVCTHPQASACVTHQGISVKGARVDGELDLQFAMTSFPLYFEKTALPSGINLERAEVRAFNLSACHCGPIHADGVRIGNVLFLHNRTRVQGGVSLLDARIGGDLGCKGAAFVNEQGSALAADRLQVGGSVFLGDGFRADGEVRLLGARIGGNLQCDGGCFVGRSAHALNADGIRVEGAVFLRKGFSAEGDVRLVGASIQGQLNCTGGQFVKRKKLALDASGARVQGAVFLKGKFTASGQVRLVNAKVGGSVECDGGQFKNATGDAIRADGLSVDGPVFMRYGFRAEGTVSLIGAVIGGELSCIRGQFIKPCGDALVLDGATVGHSVLLYEGFRAEGKVDLTGARVRGHLAWNGIASPETVSLDLRSARLGTLWDDSASWPRQGNLLLHGLVYDTVHDAAPVDANRRKQWLRLQPADRFSPQPYEQLASVLRGSGHEEDAKQILIAKNNDRARLTKMSWLGSLWHWFLRWSIGYGYRPWRALRLILFFIVVGWILFGLGLRANVITPTQEWAYLAESGTESAALSEQYPRLCPLAYSLDTFVPLVDLHQSSYWLPNANSRGQVHVRELTVPVSGSALRVYLWIHMCGGWFFTTLLVVGLTGLVRR